MYEKLMTKMSYMSSMDPNMFVFWSIVVLLLAVFWVWMLIDVLTRDMKDGDKVSWVVAIVFTNLLGAVLYYVFVKAAKKPAMAKTESIRVTTPKKKKPKKRKKKRR